ncbi:dehydrogenase, partial [Francisella tularensis]|nr:dehydrogenase [Francisella tularensis]
MLSSRTHATAIKYYCLSPAINYLVYLTKGYYRNEAHLVSDITHKIILLYGVNSIDGTYTIISCYLIDLADYIEYSTYDVGDAIKQVLIDPLSITYIT